MTDVKMTDEEYMDPALKLAQKGEDRVGPNPLVGAIIIKDGMIIGRGYHREYGGPHAEREVLASLTRTARDATLYVTLEPCCHCGKTPPCTDAIMGGGTSRVVIGTADPNPLVAGKGISLLNSHGIQAAQGVPEAECISQNQAFFHFIRTKQPYAVAKYVMIMGGKTVTCMGWSRWITGDEARMRVHRGRNRYSATMAGVGAILKDDPLLTCRLPDGRNPVRIICDIRLHIPATSRTVSTARSVRTILATCCTEENIIRPYEEVGYEILTLSQVDRHADLAALTKRLGEVNIDSTLLEGGAALNWSALDQGLVHKVRAYVAPKLSGGKDAPSPVDRKGVGVPGQALFLKQPRITVLGDGILLESKVSVRLQA